MTDSIPLPAYADFTQYNHIQSVRPTDGSIIRAQRVMVDENTPIRWTIILKDRMEQFLHYENTEGGVREYYSTSELLELVKREGFGEWRQSKVNEKQGEFLISEYQIPDLTPYPID